MVNVCRMPFFFNHNPFLSNERRKPSITIGTTTGLCSFMICAVPLRTGFSDLVVPCGKVITQPSCKAFLRCSVALGLPALLSATSLHFARQGLSAVLAPLV